MLCLSVVALTKENAYAVPEIRPRGISRSGFSALNNWLKTPTVSMDGFLSRKHLMILHFMEKTFSPAGVASSETGN
jgi:hypothetical protein